MTLGEREARDLQRAQAYLTPNIGDALFGEYTCRPCASYGHQESDHAPLYRCKRCHLTARQAGTPILGDVCGTCADDLRQDAMAYEHEQGVPLADRPDA